jgi:TPP-dependent pyruvate/acetoin dehydrogenase alpha subunit
MLEAGYASAEEMDGWQAELADQVQRALAAAQQEDKPDPWHEEWEACSRNPAIPSQA